jgi:capsular exopolysaccharide synthesis family protein
MGVTTPGPPETVALLFRAAGRLSALGCRADVRLGSQAATQEASPLELRQYLDILKRHKWFIIEAVVVVGLAAGIFSGLRTPIYEATARVLLTPNDPTQQLNPTGGNGVVGNDPDRYVTGQINIIQSEGVAREAAKTLNGVTFQQVEAALSAKQTDQSNVVSISATDPDPGRARDIVNAVAKGYIENRRVAAVSGLQQAADDIQKKLEPLQSQIAQLDARIGSAPGGSGATSALVSPVNPGTSTAPDQPAAQVDPGATHSGGAPTTQEGLKAARYAAAVQYETLYSRQQELLVDISLKRGDAELIAEAKTPGQPVSPHPKRDAALGLTVGLLRGLGISVVREKLGDRIRSSQEVERITGLPMLAQLPYDDVTKASAGLAVVEHPLGPLSEALRSLRTSIQYLGVDHPVKVIIVTSAFPGEGKSLVAANLAAAFAQAGNQTLLISADLRRSGVEGLFGPLDESPGLTGVLAPFTTNGKSEPAHNGNGASGGLDLATHATQAVLRTKVRQLFLLPAGAVPPNPAELLGSERMQAVVAGYASGFQTIVIDSPPLLAVTDAAVLASSADGVVLVTAVNETRREGLRRAMAVLEGTGARVLGTVVNKVTKSQGYYGYDSKYYGAPSSGDQRISRSEKRAKVAKVKSSANAAARSG